MVTSARRVGSAAAVRTKQALAVEVCAVLALAAARNNDRVGAGMGHRPGGAVRPASARPPARTPNHQRSARLRGRGTAPTSRPRSSSPTRSCAGDPSCSWFPISSPPDTSPLWSDWLGAHDVIALQLYDPRERELPDVGLVSLQEPESGTWRLVDTSRLRSGSSFRRRAEEFDHRLQQNIRQHGGDLVRLETGRPTRSH